MADLRKWKPFFARLPGATILVIGAILILPYLPLVLGAWLHEKGYKMMKRKQKGGK